MQNSEAIQLLESWKAPVRPELSRRGYRVVKRAFDIAASGIAIAVLAIPSAALCLVIYAKSPGASPIYSQVRLKRVGADGSFQFFRMLKFRSMVPDADKMLADLLERNDADGPLFKMKEDPRVIPGIGQFIRKHSIDELPQLVNVFMGDMSLIGPRPALPREVVLYDDRAMLTLAVKPGCGGIWQTTSRSDSSFGEKVDMDLEYIRKRSVAFDMRLILGTVKQLFTGGGAY